MKFRVWIAATACGALLGGSTHPAHAQAMGTIPDAPTLTEISPPSAARGSTVEITLNGQHVGGTKKLLCRYSSFPRLIEPEDRGLKAEVSSATDGQVKAKLTIPEDAPPGLHEIRALTGEGVTTPEYFYVSQFQQVDEHEPNNTPEQANPVVPPVTVAGTVDGGNDQDCFSFNAKKGQRLIFEVEGFHRFSPPQNQQDGIVYLDSVLSLKDASGRELAYNDDFNGVDAFIAYEFQQDGKYVITVRDSTYRGRGDFHYRLTIGDRPTITAVFPPGGQKGQRVAATVYGYDLDANGATSVKRFIQLSESAGAQEYRLSSATGISNALPVVAGDFPEAMEIEPNDRPQDATPVVIPVVCNGKFDRLDDVDGYRFEAQGGQKLVVDIQAARLGSPVDTFLTFMDRAGHILKEDDDGSGGPDSHMEVDIPRTDEYEVFVRNQVRSGFGPQQFYRLTIRTLQPGFGVTFRQQGVNRQGAPTQVPVDGIAVPAGGSTEVELSINRYEGQSGDMAVRLNTPPDLKTLNLVQLNKIMKADEDGGTPKLVRTDIIKLPLVKNGQNKADLQISAPADMAPGTYMGVYVKVSGMAGAQPFVINKKLWITVEPKQ